jgi:hypothetical protein
MAGLAMVAAVMASNWSGSGRMTATPSCSNTTVGVVARVSLAIPTSAAKSAVLATLDRSSPARSLRAERPARI